MCPALQAVLVRKAQPARRDPQDRQALQERQALKVHRAQPEPLAHKAQPGHKGLKVCKD